MIREITAKTLLQTVRQPDPWFGLKYNFNLYRGCQHQCIYCDSRSECYQIENFSDILVKVNAIQLLEHELPRKRIKGTIGTGSMNDPYMPLEAERRLTRQALEVIARHQFPVHIITKGSLVTRDLDVLEQINRVYAAVSFTITTASDELGKKLEPGAALVSQRLAALQAVAARGILTGVTLMPVLPFIEDTEENIIAILDRAAQCGARYVIPAFGMTLRDRQRAYYYTRLDQLFPGLHARYERRFGERYEAQSPNAARLGQVFSAQCARLGLLSSMPKYAPSQATQLKLI